MPPRKKYPLAELRARSGYSRNRIQEPRESKSRMMVAALRRVPSSESEFPNSEFSRCILKAMSIDRFAEVAPSRQCRAGGGEARIERQHQEGKLLARERSICCSTKVTSKEMDPSWCGHRSREFGMDESGDRCDEIHHRLRTHPGVWHTFFAQDSRFSGGSLSEANAQKNCKIMDLGSNRRARDRPTIRARTHPGGVLSSPATRYLPATTRSRAG